MNWDEIKECVAAMTIIVVAIWIFVGGFLLILKVLN